jgi:hypothetical protein
VHRNDDSEPEVFGIILNRMIDTGEIGPKPKSEARCAFPDGAHKGWAPPDYFRWGAVCLAKVASRSVDPTESYSAHQVWEILDRAVDDVTRPLDPD